MTGDSLFLAMIMAGLVTFAATMAIAWAWRRVRRGHTVDPSEKTRP